MLGNRRLLVRWAVVVAVMGVAGTAVAAVRSVDQPAAVPTHQAVRVDPPRPAIVVGDSAIAALRWVPGADNAVVGFDHTLDLESCRRLYQTSCSGREGRRPPTVYKALADHGDRYDILVVATGYNDGTADFENSFKWVVHRARQNGYSQIIWYTLRSDVDYVSPNAIGNHQTYAVNNQVVRRLLATGAFPDVELADWGGYTADKPEWFVTDGVHFRATGAWAAADYLSRKMAYLDGRACLFPVSVGEAPQNPCPDPDETGPIADIESLYPIGQDGVLCYEVGVDHRVECRYDTHVIRITRELEIGMTGRDVNALQIRLKRLGFLQTSTTGSDGDAESGFADGVFGPVTQASVTAYQKAQQLPATGVADREVLKALGFDVGAVVSK